MIRLLFLISFVLALLLTSCHRAYNPSLYPNSIDKTIRYFNYCLNRVENKEIFLQVEDIFIGRAKEEFEKLEEILYQNDKSKLNLAELTFREKQKEAYIQYAKSLKVEITKVENRGENTARAFVLFFNKEKLTEDAKVIRIIKDDGIWKISSILPLSK